MEAGDLETKWPVSCSVKERKRDPQKGGVCGHTTHTLLEQHDSPIMGQG